MAAIEIYNKSDFLYREEAFAVLAINGSELLLKSKWPHPHEHITAQARQRHEALTDNHPERNLLP